MLPMLFARDWREGGMPGSEARRRALKLMIVGMSAFFAIGAAALLDSGVSEMPLFNVVVAAALMLVGAATLLLLSARLSTDATKSKRGADGLDMYSMIDRMVDDLDDDEAAYLQRRLDEREGKTKHDLTASLEALLDQRAEDRQQRR